LRKVAEKTFLYCAAVAIYALHYPFAAIIYPPIRPLSLKLNASASGAFGRLKAI
jgi:hypothetical protein